MKLTRPSLLKATLSVGLVGTLGGLGAMAVPLSAQAESGYRVCGVYNSAQNSGAIGTGLVTKVWKNDNSDTCGEKVAWMAAYYGYAWTGSSAENDYRMVTCEEFAARTGTVGDPCTDMEVNKIYRNYSAYDLRHPQAHGRVQYWHE
ncbi:MULTISPECIES: hypothetical protein [unclassified Rathayibacter]|uniref:hypothetical protein n=1 Tax=unclassified Rathayibacter TaxID=2609250 RepID=UPI00188DBA16|nr:MULTISPECIES: hypothetical protein [unclassified Rathayibacter]MBF4461147.1 hypothetical protein [Rathayibacter sp. VKM Ac-2879]MBF4502558.1 hypothetical protein [Rathayibacter sp. VKM Ac-2878]